MKASHGKSRAIISEINITPLTDIFLVLLIIVMVVAPVLASARREIRSPKISDGEKLEQGRFTVEIAGDGGVYLDGTQVSDSELPGILATRAEVMRKKDLVIRADRTVKSHAVMQVLKAAKTAGFERVMMEGVAQAGDRGVAPDLRSETGSKENRPR